MYYRKIATGMIESTFECYQDWKKNNELSVELNMYNDSIPVWRDMSDNTKCAAIEYVYANRDTLELHSDMVESWVQATAYFMMYSFAIMLTRGEEPELEMFFDDLDFMIDEDTLEDSNVQEFLGISPDFTGKF